MIDLDNLVKKIAKIANNKVRHCPMCGLGGRLYDDFDKEIKSLLKKLDYKEIESIFKNQLPARSE